MRQDRYMSNDSVAVSRDTGQAARDALIGIPRQCARCNHELAESAFARPRTARRSGSAQCRACEATPPSASDLLTCVKCGQRKPRVAYRQVTSDRWRTDCLDCTKTQTRQRYREENGLARIRRDHWLRTYGLTPEAYADLLTSQRGLCAVCDVDLTALPVHQVHVDHDHRVGRVRGLLCATCNTRIAPAAETISSDLLARALAYLQRASR